MTTSLRLPVRHTCVTQPWGVNYFDFYQKMGLPYHPGIDFRAFRGFTCYSSGDGVITRAGTFSDGGNGIEIDHGDYLTFYYHLLDISVKIGDKVVAGQQIGHCDNTGKYTTADHLHYELRIKTEAGIDKVNPGPYFNFAFDGTPIGAKDYDKSRCYHRYYRGRPKGGYQNEVRILAILGQKKIWPSAEKINALVYGGWDLETVINPAMYELWSQLKKSEYLAGERSFIN